MKFKWIPEINDHFHSSPQIIIVGIETELRDDLRTLEKLKKRNVKPINEEQGHKLATDLKALKYIECSASIFIFNPNSIFIFGF